MICWQMSETGGAKVQRRCNNLSGAGMRPWDDISDFIVSKTSQYKGCHKLRKQKHETWSQSIDLVA
jgi:hypothetical protein